MKIIFGTLIACVCLHSAAAPAQPKRPAVADTCTGTYPAYWQDVDPKFAGMWQGQEITNAPSAAYAGPVFRLSDAYPRQPVDDKAGQPWRAAKFDPMFDPKTSQDTKTKLATE